MVLQRICVNRNFSHFRRLWEKKNKSENSITRMYNQTSKKMLLTYQLGWDKILVFRKLIVDIFLQKLKIISVKSIQIIFPLITFLLLKLLNVKKLKSFSLLNYIEIHSVVTIFPCYCLVSCIFLPAYLPYVSCRTSSVCCIKKKKVTLNESAQMQQWIHTNNVQSVVSGLSK